MALGSLAALQRGYMVAAGPRRAAEVHTCIVHSLQVQRAAWSCGHCSGNLQKMEVGWREHLEDLRHPVAGVEGRVCPLEDEHLLLCSTAAAQPTAATYLTV